jgi:hypothetical protein
LLKQSAVVSPKPADGLKSLIRHRFKTDRFLQSPSQIANGLNAGHEGLGLLRASAQGKTDSIARLNSLLEYTLKASESKTTYRSALLSARALTSPPRAPKTSHSRLSAFQTLQSRRPDSRSIGEQPLPLAEITGGKRRVPKFIAVQGIPLLLYSKPQPLSLGKVLRQRLAWQTKKWDQRSKMAEETIPLCEYEDAWDSIVALQGRQEGLANEKSLHGADVDNGSSDAESWQSASRAADMSIAQIVKNYEQKNLETSRRMFQVLKQERVLAAQEKADLKSRKYEQRVMRGIDRFLAAAPERNLPSLKKMTKGI